ncbi:cobalt ECF transporter T component CbiQ [Spirulina sp. CCNP1310]|uniref:cobalt ECF transporter T component CbiQ n=1 Tax=Spirulina sp. CCNP1310 TaxID=3110249 RepID=UPI002B1FF6B5|nr:cobalt ECF transporter T component CbiQ [Spirulina sp. CCNP1310]MEA5419598.1 cobalt ECF transporter T component CbiQ [Spirulina sp. CCNP1310]
MSFNIDRYAHLRSPLHRWEPRAKLIGLLALIFAFGSVQNVRVLPVMVAIALLLYGRSRLPWRFGLAQLRYPGIFIAMVVLLVPFAGGETVLWQWGILRLSQEGLLTVVRVGVRFLAIVTVTVILFGTTPLAQNLRAMRSLGLPPLLVDMALLTYRYLQEFDGNRRRMQQAMALRGFGYGGSRLSRRTLRCYAQLASSLLIRSYDQATRVYQAMILRGYGAMPRPPGNEPIPLASWGATAIALVVAGGVAIAGQ